MLRTSTKYTRSNPEPTTLIFSTLKPEKLRFSDRLDFAGRKYPCIASHKTSEGEGTAALLMYDYVQYNWLPFPPHTKGFLYFHRPPDVPCSAWGIRFRICSEPAGFHAGHDLLNFNQTPWHLTLGSIGRSYPLLCELLLREKLVTQADVQQSMALFPQVSKKTPAENVLYSFDQLFPLSFRSSTRLHVVLEGHRHQMVLRMFRDQRLRSNRGSFDSQPYSGSALAKFEHQVFEGKNTAVVRLVKLIDPPKLRFPAYDGHVKLPEEGSLVHVASRSAKGGWSPWRRNLASERFRPLRLLWEKLGMRKPVL
ncbi:unnamed protein product [Mycena citricolor]|uniref:Uncharacterized protein n=1 Tax=Mycena citricolor TaxID=2018698 RepID=A0AAD2H0Z2_9AGAR|nr:unnamed protein product [Mycena citricolor]